MTGILLADAGASKTDWAFIDRETNNVVSFKTQGINPAHLSQKELSERLQRVAKILANNRIKEINFFGAGCASNSLKEKIEESLKDFFVHSIIKVFSDITGAAKAVLGDESGIVCILGTGSASALFKNGEKIKQIPSLGFILGDEGSGVALGKKLLNAIYKGLLNNSVIERFQNEYNLPYSELLEKVYSESTPAPFIASFSPFLLNNLDDPSVYRLVSEEFDHFFNVNIIPFGNLEDYSVGMVGSIAYFFQNVLRDCAKKKNIKIGKIIKEPMGSLIEYYK